MPTDATPTALPLDGVRVIDVGNFLAGPYAGSVMGEFGADVIKVEHPLGGDPMRRFGTPTERPDATLKWLSESRNKRSVTIDLLQPEGVALFLKLVAKSDVLIENFRPGTMESWGLGWDVLHQANPKLVMLRVTGYGQTGPYRRRHGFAHIAQAFGGLNYLAGFPGETPVLPGTVPRGDYIASLFGAIGALVALRHAEATGVGQVIDVGIYEAIFRVLEEIAASYGLHGKIREREGSGSFVACPHGHFRFPKTHIPTNDPVHGFAACEILDDRINCTLLIQRFFKGKGIRKSLVLRIGIGHTKPYFACTMGIDR